MLHRFINEVALLHKQLPFVAPPKDFVIVQNGVYRGGYPIDGSSEKYGLKPFMEESTLDYINRWQKQSYFIDEEYLEYLLDLTL